MNSANFVKLIKLSVFKSAIEECLSLLKNPPGRKPASDLVEISNWYNHLEGKDQEVVAKIVNLVSHHAVFGFFAVLDGVRAIEDNQVKGTLELYYKKGGVASLLNDPTGEQLHDLFNLE